MKSVKVTLKNLQTAKMPLRQTLAIKGSKKMLPKKGK